MKCPSLPSVSFKAANVEEEREKEMIYTSKKQIKELFDLEKLLPLLKKTALQFNKDKDLETRCPPNNQESNERKKACFFMVSSGIRTLNLSN